MTAFRFNLIYGKNASVRVVDLGFVNNAQTLYGVQIGLINIIKQDGGTPYNPEARLPGIYSAQQPGF